MQSTDAHATLAFAFIHMIYVLCNNSRHGCMQLPSGHKTVLDRMQVMIHGKEEFRITDSRRSCICMAFLSGKAAVEKLCRNGI